MSTLILFFSKISLASTNNHDMDHMNMSLLLMCSKDDELYSMAKVQGTSAGFRDFHEKNGPI